MLIASSSQMPAGHGKAQRQPGERQARQDGQGHVQPRVGLAARGELAARTEELGLASAAEALPQSPQVVCVQRLEGWQKRTSALVGPDWSRLYEVRDGRSRPPGLG